MEKKLLFALRNALLTDTHASGFYTYTILSSVFITINLITLCNLTPWIDEVMFIDTSYNMAVHGSWQTTAWYRVTGQHPFSTYPPLYQISVTIWIWLFGSDIVTVRSMNLLITLILGVIYMQLMKRRGLQLTTTTAALFTLLLWGTSEMAWMYRNGRPDMMCALITSLTLLSIDHYLTRKSLKNKTAVILSSAMLFCSGVQAAVYLCAIWMFLFIIMRKNHRGVMHLLFLILAGYSLGLFSVAIFMQANDRLTGFICSFIQYSTTLSNIIIVALPRISDTLGISTTTYVQKLQELTTGSNIFEQLKPITEYHSFIILSFITAVFYATSLHHKKQNYIATESLLFIFALFIPIIMTLAGRFTFYYRWMAFLPLVGAIMFISTKHRLWRTVFCLVAMSLTLHGAKTLLPNKHYDYDNLRTFIKRQHFKPSDTVVCPFSTFYEIKQFCDTCYFIGIFPTEYVGHVDYIIEADKSEDYNTPITDYVNTMKAKNALTITDHCDNPSLTVYQVTTKQ